MHYTANGALTLSTSSNPVVDLFSFIGAARNDIDGAIGAFTKAYAHNPIQALKVLFWSRDIRGGAGERSTFRYLLKTLHTIDPQTSLKILMSGLIEEYGRFDDYLWFIADNNWDESQRKQVARRIRYLIENGNQLAAKWMPRKGSSAFMIREAMGLSPKAYRKMLVANTNVVETKMCANDWHEINLEHVPSKAMSVHSDAFRRHIPSAMESYMERVKSGEVKVKVASLNPHDLVYQIRQGKSSDLIEEQWKALPDYLDPAVPVIPVVDVSGSMNGDTIGPMSNITPMDASIAFGLYIAQRQQGPLNGAMVTFDDNPKAVKVNTSRSLETQVRMVEGMDWGGSTNLMKTFELVLRWSLSAAYSDETVPLLIIFSDMEFNEAEGNNERTNFQAAKKMFFDHALPFPKVVFWNLNGCSGNVQVRSNEDGVCMVSGFSPALLKTIFKGELTPEGAMLETINVERYKIIETLKY